MGMMPLFSLNSPNFTASISCRRRMSASILSSFTIVSESGGWYQVGAATERGLLRDCWRVAGVKRARRRWRPLFKRAEKANRWYRS